MSGVVVGAVVGLSLDELALLRGELDQARDRIVGLEADNARLMGDNERLVGEVERLRGKLEESRRAGKRQAAPFSRGTLKDQPASSGRKPGADYGRKARRLPPDPQQVDEIIKVGLPACCPDCGEAVAFDEMREQYQQEFVPARARTRCYEVALGHCTGCKRRVRGRHPDQTSEALGAAGVMLGPGAHALAAWRQVGLGVPMGKVATILENVAGIEVTAGGLHTALHTTAGDAERTYQRLIDSLRSSHAVAADETGWRIDGVRGWVWVYVGDAVTSMTSRPGVATSRPNRSWAPSLPG